MIRRFIYYVPSVGELIETEHGKAHILRIITHKEVIDEMRTNGLPEEKIRRFDLRIDRFLGDASMYYECEVVYSNGETERIDWSEYSGLRGKPKGKRLQT